MEKQVYGFLREDDISAKKAGIDNKTGICRTGLNKYLSIIFPKIKDWQHNKSFGVTKSGEISRRRPDYMSVSNKIIVEFDGLPHYNNPLNIIRDIDNVNFYEKEGYKVVRIPYFIQLTNKNVEKLFGVKVDKKLFPPNIPSLNPDNKNTPAFLCYEGIKRMAKEYVNFKDDYILEINNLKSLHDPFLTGVDILEKEFDKITQTNKD